MSYKTLNGLPPRPCWFGSRLSSASTNGSPAPKPVPWTPLKWVGLQATVCGTRK